LKYRLGFVSNSSTSSFVCEICGASEAGMDASPTDFDMIECDNGHTICQEEALDGWEEAKEKRDEEHEEDDGYYDDSLLPSTHCPICLFEVPSMPDIESYFVKEYGIPKEEVFAEVKKLNPRRKKLYPHEYNEYVMKAKDLRIEDVLNMLKAKYNGSYEEFSKYLRNY